MVDVDDASNLEKNKGNEGNKTKAKKMKYLFRDDGL